MDHGRDERTERVLAHAIKLMCLLTGENCVLLKRFGDSAKRLSKSGEWSRRQRPIPVPSSHSLIHERNNEQKILELTNRIIQLLTAEVPIRCQDVAVYLSMEEWEYVEGHKDLYKDAMMENHWPLTSLDLHRDTAADRVSNCFDKESALDEEGDIIYTPAGHTQYTSTRIKEESVSYDGGDLTHTDMYTPTGHTQYTSTHTKEEPASCDGGDLTHTDMYTPTGHTQYTSTHTKEEPASCDGGDLTHTDMYTPTGHTQDTATPIKEDFVLYENGNLTDIPFYTTTENIQYTSVVIKEEAHSCEDGNLQNTDHFACTDHTPHMSDSMKAGSYGPRALTSTDIHKPTNCLLYSTAYTEKTARNGHQTKQKPFMCSECGKAFECNT